jgi:beta-lactamase superfamily II metal-dependent hydrolase
MTAVSLDAAHRVAADVVIDIVDVGHGNCVVVRAGGTTTLVDTGPGGPLLEYLLQEGITAVDTVVISHADQDHIGGLSALLGQRVPIRQIIWNGDAAKRSAIWLDLVYELDWLETAGTIIANIEASRGLRISTGSPEVELTIIAPRPRLRRLGAGSVDRAGSAITTNSVSVVVRVLVDGQCILLVPGDLDAVGYSHLVDPDPPDLKSKYLVLPHHGGLMGTLPVTEKLIEDLIRAVSPEAVFVSNGRVKYDNPRDDVLNAIRRVVPAMPIACTQLSRRCSADPKHQVTPGPYAVGSDAGFSCAATTRLTRANGIDTTLQRTTHLRFIHDHVETPACAPSSI